MALSQKHEGKCLVPWFCSAEWHFVYNNIFGPNNNEKTKKEALNIINIWKARTPLLSRGVEGTYIILEASLLNRNAYNVYNLKLLLSTSIMRFLNICAAYNKNQGTFYTTANKMKIPEWLISLRHDIAHGQNLPSIYILERALQFSLEWLHQQYWKITSSDLKDFVDDTQFEGDRKETLKSCLHELVSNYCYITLLTHSKWGYQKIRNIPNKDTRNIFLEEIRNMTDSVNISETTELTEILAMLWQKIDEILKQYEGLENRYQVFAELLLEDVFLGNIDDREDIFKNGDKIPKDFINLWENMLMKFGTDMLGALIEKLLRIVTKDTENHESKTAAATWIFEIGTGLEKRMFIKNIIKELSKTGSKPRNLINSTVEEKLNSKYENRTILNLNSNVEIPDVISDSSKFKRLVLQKPTEYTKIFISELVDLNDTLKLPKNKEQILELVNLYVPNESSDEETIGVTKIHHVEDLDPTAMDVDEPRTDELKQYVEAKVSENVVVDGKNNKIWRRVTETNFEKCPIGILPWQLSSMNPLLISK